MARLFPIIAIYNMVVVNFERFLGVCHPMYCLSEATAKRLVKVAWLAGTVMNLVSNATFELELKQQEDETHAAIRRCKPQFDDTLSRTVGAIFLTFIYVLPVCTSIFTSVSILRVIRRREIQAVGDAAAQERKAQRRKVTIHLLTIFLVFVILHTPQKMHLAYEIFVNPNVDSLIYKILYSISVFLVFATGPVNFLIHLAELPGFYSHLKRGGRVRPSSREGEGPNPPS